jgi:cation diffusion facilitator family transporter
MSKFPDKIPLPEEIFKKRAERRKEILFTTIKGVSLRLTVILAEIIGFIYLGSSALLLDALSSVMDIGASLILMLCVGLADKAPDRHHPFGHGRFEPIAGLQLGIFLVVIGGYLGYQQLSVVVSDPSGEAISAYAWMIPLAAVFLLEIGYQYLKRVAKRQNSPALKAEAIHYRVDSLSSLFAVVALGFAAYFPKHSHLLDHIGAFAIAIFMIGIGTKATLENLNQLLDRVPSPEYFKTVHKAAMNVTEVMATEKIRIQSYGPDAHVNIDIELDPSLSVEVAHAITQKVRYEIQKAWPAVRDVIVHVEPYYENDHSSIEWL